MGPAPGLGDPRIEFSDVWRDSEYRSEAEVSGIGVELMLPCRIRPLGELVREAGGCIRPAMIAGGLLGEPPRTSPAWEVWAWPFMRCGGAAGGARRRGSSGLPGSVLTFGRAIGCGIHFLFGFGRDPARAGGGGGARCRFLGKPLLGRGEPLRFLEFLRLCACLGSLGAPRGSFGAPVLRVSLSRLRTPAPVALIG